MIFHKLVSANSNSFTILIVFLSLFLFHTLSLSLSVTLVQPSISLTVCVCVYKYSIFLLSVVFCVCFCIQFWLVKVASLFDIRSMFNYFRFIFNITLSPDRNSLPTHTLNVFIFFFILNVSLQCILDLFLILFFLWCVLYFSVFCSLLDSYCCHVCVLCVMEIHLNRVGGIDLFIFFYSLSI